MPRSRSSSMESSSCGRCPRSTAPVSSRKRSARVDLPWSMWAMMEKLRIRSIWPAMSMASGAPRTIRSRSRAVERSGSCAPAAQQAPDLVGLGDAECGDRGRVDEGSGAQPGPERDDLPPKPLAKRPIEDVPDAVADPGQRGRGADDAKRRPGEPAQLETAELAAEDDGLR